MTYKSYEAISSPITGATKDGLSWINAKFSILIIGAYNKKWKFNEIPSNDYERHVAAESTVFYQFTTPHCYQC